MTYIASGQTYNYRLQLQSMGGNFRSHDKKWEFPDTIKPSDLAYIKRMVGVTVVQIGVDLAEPERSTYGRAGQTTFIGDDPTYMGRFADKNPITFFGFSSLAELIRYIDGLPGYSGPRAAGWSTSEPTWRGTASMSDAIKLANDGWKTGVEQSKEILEIIHADNAEQKQSVYGVAGGRVNVGKMLSGNPLHMKRKAKQPAKRVITLLVDIAMIATITAETAILKAACIAAIVDLLEMKQYSCDIIAVASTADVNTDAAASHTTVRIKSAGEALNINDLVFALGHPSMQRRFHFALKSHDLLHSIWRGMGTTVIAFDETEPNEFYIPCMSPEMQKRITGKTLLERANSMIKMIKPDGLPLTLRN